VNVRLAELCQARRSCASITRMTAAGLLALAAAAAIASPYTPPSDDTVIEHVPARSELERLAPLRAAVAADPGDLRSAIALATGYIDLGRRNSDPRFIAYAQAALLPWLVRPRPSERTLLLQAITLQYLHQFGTALELLERALVLEPLDAQAWLTRASLLELRGDYVAARHACARLVRTADEFTALTCLASVAGRSGELDASLRALRQPDGIDARLPPTLRAWRLAVRAEMAERSGDPSAAEADLQAALSATPDDPYLKVAYADLLLQTGRPREVLLLLAGAEAQDPLLLRIAIAAHRLGSPDAPRWQQAYQERLRAAERDGDSTHQREQALYLLELGDDAAGALAYARRNWSVQREPADVRIYLRAAERAHSEADCMRLAGWITDTRYEDRALSTLPQCARPRESP
jgi:tetratricopeptide (TPR) repeat protein